MMRKGKGHSGCRGLIWRLSMHSVGVLGISALAIRFRMDWVMTRVGLSIIPAQQKHAEGYNDWSIARSTLYITYCVKLHAGREFKSIGFERRHLSLVPQIVVLCLYCTSKSKRYDSIGLTSRSTCTQPPIPPRPHHALSPYVCSRPFCPHPCFRSEVHLLRGHHSQSHWKL